MRVISNKMLVEFSLRHPIAEGPLKAWRKIIEVNIFTGYADLKACFHSVDKVGDFYVFNIGGHKYRIVTIILFHQKKVFVREILTHKEYNSWKP